MIRMHITKMHGLGNSQILVEDPESDLENKTGLSYNEIARGLCDPNFGIGSDQMLIIKPSSVSDFKMRVFNKDGGEAEMCGNGIRCVGKYLFDKGLVDRRPSIETKAGQKKLKIISENGEDVIEVEMGKGEILKENMKVEGFEGSLISVGNPHFVIFTDEASEELAKSRGAELEKAEEFQPERANIEFAKKTSKNEIEVYVWERGAGFTLACGTGACATAFDAKNRGLGGSKVNIKLPGGKLKIKVNDKNQIKMKGPVEYILDGEVFDIHSIYSNLE